jgi:3-keto-L-gulonate-6-phosphate decarboxylase
VKVRDSGRVHTSCAFDSRQADFVTVQGTAEDAKEVRIEPKLPSIRVDKDEGDDVNNQDCDDGRKRKVRTRNSGNANPPNSSCLA